MNDPKRAEIKARIAAAQEREDAKAEQSTTQRVADKASDAGDAFTSFVKEHPLASAAGGVALGILIAGMFKGPRRARQPVVPRPLASPRLAQKSRPLSPVNCLMMPRMLAAPVPVAPKMWAMQLEIVPVLFAVMQPIRQTALVMQLVLPVGKPANGLHGRSANADNSCNQTNPCPLAL